MERKRRKQKSRHTISMHIADAVQGDYLRKMAKHLDVSVSMLSREIVFLWIREHHDDWEERLNEALDEYLSDKQEEGDIHDQ